MSDPRDHAEPAVVDVKRLRYFVAVAEELHFTRAAGRLGITQSSLSAAIRRLEDERGVELFRRSTRSVALTAEGERLLVESRALLAAVERFIAPPRPTTTLRVGVSPPLRRPLLDAIVAECTRQGSRVIAVRQEFSGALLRGVNEGSLDVALTLAAPQPPAGVLVERLTAVPLKIALAASDPRTARPSLALAELADLGLQVFGDPDGAGARAAAVLACRDAGLDPRLYISAYPYATPELSDGRAFALRPDVPDQWFEGVVYVPITPPAPTVSIELARRPGHNDVIAGFAEIARRVSGRVVP
jgi:DNA-binding transcriptional LysR family regulator